MSSEQRRNEEARREMFAAIRSHLAVSAPHDAVRAAHHAAAAHGEDVSAREEKSTTVMFEGTAVERFRQALESVAGRCLVVRDEAGAAEVVRQIAEGRN